MTTIIALVCYGLLLLALAVLVIWEHQRIRRERRNIESEKIYDWRLTIKSRI